MALEINHRRGGMEGGRSLLEVGEIVCVWQGGVQALVSALRALGILPQKAMCSYHLMLLLTTREEPAAEILGTNELARAPPEPGGREEKLRFSPR